MFSSNKKQLFITNKNTYVTRSFVVLILLSLCYSTFNWLLISTLSARCGRPPRHTYVSLKRHSPKTWLQREFWVYVDRCWKDHVIVTTTTIITIVMRLALMIVCVCARLWTIRKPWRKCWNIRLQHHTAHTHELCVKWFSTWFCFTQNKFSLYISSSSS